MANETSNIKVNVNLRDAIKDFETFDQRVTESKDSIISLEAQIIRLEKERAQLDPKAMNRLRDYNEAIDKTKTRLKEEKNDLKQLNAERTKAKKKVTSLTKATKKNTGVTGLLNTMTGGLIARFKAMQVATMGAVKGLTAMRIALLASGIGIIVLAITGLIAAFKRSEEGQNKFNVLMAKIGVVMNELLDVLATFGEFIIDVFTKPKEVWESFVTSMREGYEFIKDQVINRITGRFAVMAGKGEKSILKMRISWKKFWGNDEAVKALTKELDNVNKKIEEGQKKIDQANKEIIKSYVNSTLSMNEYFGKLKREQKIATKIAQDRNKADKIDRALIVERAEATRKVNELREKASRRENFSTQERIKFLTEAGEVEQAIVNKQIAAAKIRLRAKQAENDLGKTTKADLDEVAKLQAKVIDLEGKRLRKQKAISAEITTNQREQKAEIEKSLADYVFIPGIGYISKEGFEKIQQNQEGIKAIQDGYKRRAEDEAAETELQKIELEKERALAELERLNATEQQKADIIAFYANKTKKQEEKNADASTNLDKQVAAAKMSQAKQAFALVGELAGKGSKVGKIAAIGQTVISGIQSVQNAFTTASLSPITAVNPGYPLQQAIIAGAFSAAQLAKLIATNPESPSVGGLTPAGGGSQPAVPTFNIVGQGATSQLAASIAEQESEPVQAYVVSQDVTTAQSLENNIISGATLGG